MTLQEIAQNEKDLLNVEDIASYLKAAPQSLRSQAQIDAEKLGFPVIVIGTTVKIPRDGFVYFIKYGRPIAESITKL